VDEERVNGEAIAALAAEPALFHRGNMLSHVLRDDAKKSNIVRPPGSPRIAVLPNARLREMMAARADWQAWKTPKKGDPYMAPAHPPAWSVAGVAARGQWKELRYLEAVVEAPTLRHDGTVLDAPGYDDATGLLYEPRIDFSSLPAECTRYGAELAAERLLDLVTDFPFADVAHKVAWLAALLTVAGRFAFEGPAPLFLFTANTPGAGKTLLASIIAWIVEGRDVPRSAYPVRDEEMAKTITAVAMAGDRMMLLDNIDQSTPLGCPSLDAALTGVAWRSRILGVSEMTPDLPLLTVWMASGNNVALRGDIHRRVIPCQLDARDERPEERAGFKYPHLVEHVRQQRAALVVDTLTILRAYFAAGKPDQQLPPFGSFEGWSAVVRSAIHWATGVDPVAARAGIADTDEATGILTAILAGWAELPELPGRAGEGNTVAEALRLLRMNEDNYQTLRDAFALWSRTDKLPPPKTIGRKLAAMRGRVANGKALKGFRDRDGITWWRVVDARTGL
jgi:hypothetical protein